MNYNKATAWCKPPYIAPFKTKYLRLIFTLLACSYFLFNSCTVSLKSTGIPPSINTFFIEEFDNNARNVVPTLSYDFTQALLDKIRNESRLNYADTDPDVIFSGNISRYEVTSVAPEENNGVATTAFNRLDMAVQVNYINTKEDDPKKKEWSQQFNFFVDFESDQNLLDVQESLIEELNAQLVEDIFNKAFSGW